MPGESPMNLPGVSNRFCLCNLGLRGVSQYRTLLPRTTRVAIFHSALLAASSGLFRANRRQDCPRHPGAELDAALLAAKCKQYFIEIP